MCQTRIILCEFMQWVMRSQPAVVDYDGNLGQGNLPVLEGRELKGERCGKENPWITC